MPPRTPVSVGGTATVEFMSPHRYLRVCFTTAVGPTTADFAFFVFGRNMLCWCPECIGMVIVNIAIAHDDEAHSPPSQGVNISSTLK